MARRKAEVAITCNIRQPQQAQRILISALEALRKEYDRLVNAGKQNEAETQKIKSEMDSLSSAVNTNEQAMNRINTVMSNLSGSTLRQLNSALRELKKQLNSQSTDSATLDQLRAKYNAITEQIKILKGETINITKGIRTLSSQSDAWLNAAINKQQNLVNSTKQNTAAYSQQRQVLKQLQAEQQKRTLNSVYGNGQKALTTTNIQTASAAQLTSARKQLVSYRDNIGANGIDLGSTQANAAKIKEINTMLGAIDKQIESINGKEQQTAQSAQQIVQSVKQIDFSKATPNQLKAKLDEVNNALGNMAKNDPMRTRLVQSANELRSALSSLNQESVNVKGVLANLDKASPQKLKAALDQVNRSLERMGQNDSRRKELIKQANQLKQALANVDKEAVDVNRVLKNLKRASLDDLKRAASQLEAEMAKLDRRTDSSKFAQKRNQIHQINKEVQRLNGSVKARGGAWEKTFQAITAYMGVTMLIGEVTSMISKTISLNLKLSDSLADIRKVSGLAVRDVDKLSNRLASIDSRTTLEELHQIAYAGAKLGIGKYGVEGLEGFTRAANQVNVALKEELGSDALTALSKITEVMGLIPKVGVEQSMLATGSAMFKLSATSTATAGNIVEFSKRLTGLAKVTGITTDQLLGLASASDSMYLMPEVSATAFNKLFTSIQTKHNLIEKELGIEKGTINDLYSAGRAMDAIILIFEKMKEKGNMNALQGVFKDLGSDGARLVNVMVTMSQNVDMLKSHLEVAKEAFEDGTAVTTEYNIQQETAQALMQRASNMWEKAFINPEGVDNVKNMAKAWYDLTKELTDSPIWSGTLKVALSMVAFILKTILYLLPALLTGLMFKGVVGGIASIVLGLKNMNKGITFNILATNGLTAACRTLTAAWRTLNAVQKVNLIAATISILLSLATVISSLAKKTATATEYMKGFNAGCGEVEATLAKSQSEFELYKKAIEDAAVGTKERAAAIKNFNEKYGQYLDKMLTEKSTAEDLAEAYKRVNNELRRKALLELKEKDISEQYTPAVGWAANKLYDYGEIAEKSSHKQYNAQWLKGYFEDKTDLQTAIYGLSIKLGLDDYEANRALEDRNSIPKTLRKYNQKKGVWVQVAATPEEQMIYAAARYGAQYFSNKKRLATIDKKYTPYEEEMKAPETEEKKMDGLEDEAPDKDALKEAQRQADARKKRLEGELKDAQDEARAIIDNVKNYYERQITKVLETANEQGWGEAMTQSAIDVLRTRENLALSNVRKAIAGVQNEWNEFKETMESDMLETQDEVGYNESQVLLDLITSNNIEALREKLNGLAKDLGKPANAATDAIWKNATMSEKANATAEQRHLQERNKLLLQDSYTSKVNSDYSETMTRLGYFDVDSSQAATLVAGGENAENLLKKRADEIESVLKNARERFTDLIAIDDVTTTEGRVSLLDLLFGEGWSKDKSTLKNVFDLESTDLGQFYDEIIKYVDDYTEAQKRAFDRAKKLADFKWNESSEKKAYDQRERTVDRYQKGILQHIDPSAAEGRPDFGVHGNTAVMSSFGVDPEIESYRLKLEAAKAYYDFLRAQGLQGAQLHEQEMALIEAQSNYVEKLAAKIKQQMDDVLSLTQPVEDFGTKVGEAFATMTEDAEAGRKAMKAAIADMMNSFMKQTVEMTKEYIKRRLLQKMNDRLVQLEMRKEGKAETSLEGEKHDQLIDIQSIAGKTKEMLAVSIGGKVQEATAQIGQETLQTQQAQTQTEIQTESAKTQAETTMGIAQGASKIIGSLGWWGIPLIAVITALLNGLLSFAMSKVSSLFGGGSSSADTGAQTKLVSGMLTYDSGNVQAFRGVIDGRTYPVVGSDGKVYAAKDGGELSTGLVRDPITTFVNGQPALVAERGPEMVIGRETTAAMMMARPDILAEIVRFDRMRSGRTFRAFDAGNLNEFSLSGESSALDLSQLQKTMQNLAVVLDAIQRNGINAHINKYGRGGVTEAATSGKQFMRQNSSNPLWHR